MTLILGKFTVWCAAAAAAAAASAAAVCLRPHPEYAESFVVRPKVMAPHGDTVRLLTDHNSYNIILHSIALVGARWNRVKSCEPP
jgi:hypothetical protein